MHKRSRTGLYIRLAAALAAAASLIPVCALDDVRGAPTNSVSAYEKFDVILKRSPFGPPPPVVLSAKEIAAAALAQAPVEQEKVTPLTAVVRLNAITRYDGLPAAGFVDKESNASYFLVEGQTIEDYTLDEVSLAKSSIILTKGGQTEEIFLSFASGQPTNIVPIAGTKFLTALDFRKRGEEAPQEVAAEEAAPEVTEVEAAAAPVEGEPRLSPRLWKRRRSPKTASSGSPSANSIACGSRNNGASRNWKSSRKRKSSARTKNSQKPAKSRKNSPKPLSTPP